jgi:hypothetical protein
VTKAFPNVLPEELPQRAMFMLEFFFNMGDATLARAREGA